MKTQTKGMVAAFSANFFFGLSFLFSKIAMKTASVFLLLSIRFTLAFLVLNVLAALGVVRLNFRGKKLWPLLLTSLLQPVIYFICDNNALRYATTSLAGAVIAVVPVMAMVFSALFLKEIPTRRQVICMILSCIGVVVVSLSGSSVGVVTPLGLVLLAGTVVSAAGFNVMSKRLADRFSPFERTYVMFAMGVSTFTLCALAENGAAFGRRWLAAVSTPSFMLAVLYLSVLSSVVAFLLINYSLSKVSVARSASFANVTTVVSVLAGVLLLKESLTPLLVGGMAVILVGVYGVNAQVRQRGTSSQNMQKKS